METKLDKEPGLEKPSSSGDHDVGPDKVVTQPAQTGSPTPPGQEQECSTPQAAASASAKLSMHDTGTVINFVMSPEEVDKAVREMTSGEKYDFLTDHFKPSSCYIFPLVYMNSCNRQFQHSWLKKHPWLTYSHNPDGGFYLPCALFCTDRSTKGVLVNRPFMKWTKSSTPSE